MAERFDLVTDIHQRNMHWHIQVYVIKMYDVPSTEKPNTIKIIDLILQDRQVFNIYNMREFVVVDKRAKVKVSQVRWSLLFCNRTVVQEVEVPTFPLEAFRVDTVSPVIFDHDRIK
ncbi:hypothetical protein PIB30_037979 [Stylosanthes scabra]|uniref:Uncharacterized protein n=1 Tax=Stylosanthes scabra TaxID=79078 RepID=A0ABU6YB67_9FABA|nr:hypothetical protein [Stylosanthes scabra]